MFSKNIKSAISILLIGSLIAAVPTFSTAAASADTASVSASSSSFYYNQIYSEDIPDGEYIIYNSNTQTLMTNEINSGNNSFPSYSSGTLSNSVTGSRIPSQYRYKITKAGNGYYYIQNQSGQYLDIVRYGALAFTSTPTALQFQAVTYNNTRSFVISKNTDSGEMAISMYASDWFTVHNKNTSSAGQCMTLFKYGEGTANVNYLSQYNIANYDSEREFTPKRHGNITTYTQNTLQMYFGNTNRIMTGIWATPGETVKIYVQAEDGDALPSVLFTQHISDSREIKEVKLQKGLNEIVVPTIHADLSTYKTPTEAGGCMYLLNPYTTSQQGNNVKVYIEGGDKVPTFTQNGDVKAYVQKLKEYYPHYKNGEKGYHNVSEISSKHICLTLTLDRIYDAYVKEGLDPQATTENWDSFYEYMLEVDGITSDQYENLYHHVKINQPYGGAYAHYDIVAVQDNDWSAFSLSGIRAWGFPHEFGHILDNKNKVLTEVTNNVWSLKYVLDNEQYDSIAIGKDQSDFKTLAVNEVNSFWSENPKNYKGVYMFWDLEVYHDGYWGELDGMFRKGSTGNAAADSYLSSCTKYEKVSLFSSQILGIDLTYYFKRYGYLPSNPSSAYTNAVNALSLSKAQPKIWYYDVDAYLKLKKTSSNNTLSANVSLAGYDSSKKTLYFNVPKSKADSHMGFEIVQNGKVIDFVWDSKYTNSSMSGTYTVNAYDRNLNQYSSITVNTSSLPNNSAARVGNTYYATLKEAVESAPNNATVYVANTTYINDSINIDGKSITLMPLDENRQTVIYNNVSGKDVFNLKNGAVLTLKTSLGNDNTLVFDSADNSSLSYFRMYSASQLNIGKGVTVRRCVNKNAGSVIYAENTSKINLTGCIIERNKTSNRGTVYLTTGSELHSSNNTIIRYNTASVAGSFLYCSNENDKVYLENTQIYKNYSINQANGGTIYMSKGSVFVGNGTSIKGNDSDWYYLRNAMYISKDAKAEFSGKLDITDNVSVCRSVYVSPSVSGTLKLRAEADYTAPDFVLAVPLDNKTFGSNILNVVKYTHNTYNAASNASAIYISEFAPLINNSSVSSKSIILGNSVKLTGSATGGSGGYTYAVYYKRSNTSTWTKVQDYQSSITSAVKPLTATNYTIRVKLKDSKGTIVNKDFSVKVTDILKNTAKVSSTNIELGNTVTVTGAATGGSGSYQYAVYYKKTSDTKWVEKQSFSSNAKVSVKPAQATNYDICVKVKDSKGTIEKKYFSVHVSKALVNNATLSANTIQLGKTVTVKASATGGSGYYNYAVYYRRANTSTWTTAQSYQSNSKVSIKPLAAVNYEICVKVKDSNGKEVKKYFTLAVKSTALTNQSTVSATSIKLGKTVTVKAAATGGSGSYQYAVYYKKASDTKWTEKQAYKSTSTVSVKPAHSTTYQICVKVKDSKGTIEKKYFNVSVTK